MDGMAAILSQINQQGANMLSAYQVKGQERQSEMTRQLMQKKIAQEDQKFNIEQAQKEADNLIKVMTQEDPIVAHTLAGVYGLKGANWTGPIKEFSSDGQRFSGSKAVMMNFLEMSRQGKVEEATQYFLQNGGMITPDQQPENIPKTLEAAAIMAMGPEQRGDPNFLLSLDHAGKRQAASTQNTTIITGRESELGKKFIDNIPKMKENAFTSASALSRINQVNSILDKEGDNVIGLSGAIKRALAPYAAAVGMSTDSMTNAQILNSLLSSNAGSLRMEVVGPGPVSNYEQQILQDVSGKKMSTEAGIRAILKHNAKSHERNIDTYNESVYNLSTIPGFEAAPKLYAPVQKPEAASKETYDVAPVAGAKKAADGNWYVERDGKFFKVVD